VDDAAVVVENTYRRFKLDAEKAVRRGISTDTINRAVEMAMGGYRLGDVKQGEPLRISQ
jgi:multidrug efflux pump subunit AcrB